MRGPVITRRDWERFSRWFRIVRGTLRATTPREVFGTGFSESICEDIAQRKRVQAETDNG